MEVVTREELIAAAEALEWAAKTPWPEYINSRTAILAKAEELRAKAEAMNNGAAQGMAQPEGADTTRVEVPAAAPPSVALPVKLWLWKNFVDGRPEYWAFDNPYPIHMDCGDPQTVGEPVGYALVKQSRNGRPEVSEEQILSAIKRATPPDLAARVARLEAALRLIASCESRAPGDVVDIARAALARWEA